MVNLFDNTNALKLEPDLIVVGDRSVWRKTNLASTYPSDTYSVTYISRVSSGGGTHEFSVSGVADGNDYLFTILSSNSDVYDVGKHRWQLEVTRSSDSERIILQTGFWDIITDLDNNIDPRSHAEVMLEKIESVLQGRADADIASYSISGRSLTKIAPNELIEWRNFYRAELTMERRKDLIKNGKATSATIKYRFT